jgi:hypothetical protein
MSVAPVPGLTLRDRHRSTAARAPGHPPDAPRPAAVAPARRSAGWSGCAPAAPARCADRVPSRFGWTGVRPRRRPGHATVPSREGAAGTVMESSRPGCRGANLGGCGRWRGTTSRVALRRVPFVSFCRERLAGFTTQRAARRPSRVTGRPRKWGVRGCFISTQIEIDAVRTHREQPNRLGAAVGSRLAPGSTIVTDGDGRTGVRGVYAAGDAATDHSRSVANAIGSGLCVAYARWTSSRSWRRLPPDAPTGGVGGPRPNGRGVPHQGGAGQTTRQTARPRVGVAGCAGLGPTTRHRSREAPRRVSLSAAPRTRSRARTGRPRWLRGCLRGGQGPALVAELREIHDRPDLD